MSVYFLCKAFVVGFGCVCLLFSGCFVIQVSVWYICLAFLCVFFLRLDNISTPLTYVYI